MLGNRIAGPVTVIHTVCCCGSCIGRPQTCSTQGYGAAHVAHIIMQCKHQCVLCPSWCTAADAVIVWFAFQARHAVMSSSPTACQALGKTPSKATPKVPQQQQQRGEGTDITYLTANRSLLGCNIFMANPCLLYDVLVVCIAHTCCWLVVCELSETPRSPSTLQQGELLVTSCQRVSSDLLLVLIHTMTHLLPVQVQPRHLTTEQQQKQQCFHMVRLSLRAHGWMR